MKPSMLYEAEKSHRRKEKIESITRYFQTSKVSSIASGLGAVSDCHPGGWRIKGFLVWRTSELFKFKLEL